VDAELSAILATADQLWADARRLAADFERIANCGADGSARDERIVRAGLHLLALELGIRGERWDEDAPPPAGAG